MRKKWTARETTADYLPCLRRHALACLAGAAGLLAGCGGGGAGTPAASPPPVVASPAPAPGPAPQPAPAPAPAPASPSTAMNFALMDTADGASVLDRHLAMAQVDGVAVRTSWQSLEPTRRGYDWTAVDVADEAAARHGKKWGLHVMAAVFASPPAWLSAQGMQTYSYRNPAGSTVVDPVPWDDVYLTEWRTFMAAMAAHLQARGALERLSYVSVAVPVPEMSLPGCANGTMGTAGPAYSREQYLAAWQSAIQSADEALPTVLKLLPVPFTIICRPDTDGPALYTELFDHALARSAPRFGSFAADLQGTGSTRLDGVPAAVEQAPVVLQFIGAASASAGLPLAGTLLEAVCKGRQRYRGVAFETYKADLASTDPAIQSAVAAIRAGEGCPAP